MTWNDTIPRRLTTTISKFNIDVICYEDMLEMVTWQVQREVLDTGFARSEPNRVCLRATRDRDRPRPRDHKIQTRRLTILLGLGSSWANHARHSRDS